MKITDEQINILELFKCERLSSNDENKSLIKSFESRRGLGLVNTLKSSAWDEDVSGNTAWYLIKAPNGKPCMFFALKCGALYRPLDETAIHRKADDARNIMTKLQSLNPDDPDHKELMVMLEEMRTERNKSMEELVYAIATNIKEQKSTAEKILYKLEDDRNREGNRPIMRVEQTYSGIELTHFCTDDNEKTVWDEYDFRFPLGEVMFWKYIAPICIDIKQYVGCQFVFLFAADSTVDGTLTNYYNVALKFSKLTDVGTNKPYYDIGCEFMSQEVSELEENRRWFFNNFNIDEDDQMI